MNNLNIYNIVSKYIHNQTHDNITRMYIDLLEELQRSICESSEEGMENEDIETIQNVIDIINNL